jgi:hypothetical protein
MQDLNSGAVLAGILISNIAVMVGAYVSLRVAVAEMRVAQSGTVKDLDKLSIDVDRLASKLREAEKSIIMAQK